MGGVLLCLPPLCNFCALCVSVVVNTEQTVTTETQSTQRLHREFQMDTSRFMRSMAVKG